MALRMSTALRNYINAGGSLRQALNGGKIKMFSGAQPASANDAESGTLLVTITKSGGTHTSEVQATGTLSLDSGASGNISSVKVNSEEILNGTTTFNSSLAQTASDLAAAINNNPQNTRYRALATSTAVILTANRGLGALVNGHVLSGTVSTIGATFGTMASGVTPVNGLNWAVSSNGTMTKRSDESWQGTAVADGTAGWFRWIAGVSDAGSADSTETYLRLDGSVAASGAQLNGATAIANGSVQTITANQLVIAAS